MRFWHVCRALVIAETGSDFICQAGSGSALQQTGAAATAFGAQAGAATRLAGLLVILATAHFLLDSTSLDELAETADRFLNRFTIPHIQLNHMSSFYDANGTNLIAANQGEPYGTHEYMSCCRSLSSGVGERKTGDTSIIAHSERQTSARCGAAAARHRIWPI
jgi:hypothetical protein